MNTPNLDDAPRMSYSLMADCPSLDHIEPGQPQRSIRMTGSHPDQFTDEIPAHVLTFFKSCLLGGAHRIEVLDGIDKYCIYRMPKGDSPAPTAEEQNGIVFHSTPGIKPFV